MQSAIVIYASSTVPDISGLNFPLLKLLNVEKITDRLLSGEGKTKSGP